jgi:hypothetical protein
MDPFSDHVISDGSRKLYNANLRRLNNGEDFKNLNFLKKTADIESKLEKFAPNTRRTYLISVVSALKGKKGFEKCREHFYSKMMDANSELKTQNVKSEKFKENEMSQADIEAKQAELAAKPVSADLVLLSLFTLLPPRRALDYAELKWDADGPDNANYFDGKRFKFNRYKTAGTYGSQTVDVPPALQKILKAWRKKNNTDYVLVGPKGQKMSSTAVSKGLARILGKKLGVSALRSIYLTNKYGEKQKEMAADAKAMGTSTGTIENNYLKE